LSINNRVILPYEDTKIGLSRLEDLKGHALVGHKCVSFNITVLPV
jgi:hypothetical protein